MVMKNKLTYALLMLFSLLSSTLVAQTDQYLHCGNPAITDPHLTDPEVKKATDQLELFTKEWIASPQHHQRQQYIIPMVFHIVHEYGVENISDAQVLDEMAILNKDYNLANSDTANIIPEFKNIAANIGITFKLAQLDPQGRCTNGIDRIPSLQTNVGTDLSKLNDWPHDRYLNVWVVKTMANGIAGYAYYPGSVMFPGGDKIDGVIILQDYIGSSGTSQPLHEHALSHEIGHWLNLEHPWGNTNAPGVACGDDNVSDTPYTKGWDHCPNPGAAAICVPGVIENYQNFMDYSYCSCMFTQGQKDRMLAALNSTISGRINLWSDANLALTGVDGSSPALCQLIPDFNANHYFVCAGGSVTFFDHSYNGIVSSRQWTFSNATPATSTAANPTVTFNSPGWQTITLAVTNASGTVSLTRQSYISVGAGTGSVIGLSEETFEDATEVSDNWTTVNYDNDAHTWKRTTDAWLSGQASMMYDNFDNTFGEKDDLISPSYNLSGLSAPLFYNFRYIGSSQLFQSADIKDALRIYVSNNCGLTWSLVKTIVGAPLVNGGGYHAGYFYARPWDNWTGVSIPLTAYAGQANVRVKFEYTPGSGTNHFYLDNMNLGPFATDVTSPAAAQNGLTVYPNPLQGGMATVSVQMDQTMTGTLLLEDITGRQLQSVFQGTLMAGVQQFNLSLNGLPSGIYFLHLRTAGGNRVIKLIQP